MVLMDGLECSEILFSQIDLGDRFDAEYFAKEYLHISQNLKSVHTEKLGKFSDPVASAFYPAATQLYAIGDTAFVRCVDCIDYPIITAEQKDRFEKIPYAFGKANKGISFLAPGEIVITKVGTPCFASIVEDYETVALSRTVLGLTNITGIDPYYLMVFLRCKYGFEQLYRQRELTIQYQLTLPRVKAVDIYLATSEFQNKIRYLCEQYKKIREKSTNLYSEAERVLTEELNCFDISPCIQPASTKTFQESFLATGRLDAEYYQPKYDQLFAALTTITTNPLGGPDGIADFQKSIEPGSESYGEEGIPFVRVSDITKFGVSEPEIKLPEGIVEHPEALFPKKDSILFSKDGSVGIAYKLEEDVQFITSSALLQLTVRDTKKVLPDYLTLVLNSPVVQLQAERAASGAIIQHWKPSEIQQVIIPILDVSEQKKLSQMVQESFSLRRQSEQLLDCAKRAVELATEQGEDAAMAWLKDKVE